MKNRNVKICKDCISFPLCINKKVDELVNVCSLMKKHIKDNYIQTQIYKKEVAYDMKLKLVSKKPKLIACRHRWRY